ncbi:MAG: hypothetical protein GX317_01670, partial [Staphylococcus equorum]|nr:hypothetical protein [Staphylococcus equorum]
MDELPKNCLFDKGKVGCGGTTIALKDNENTVIAVPFISLINSKVSQIENVLGVYGDVDNETIENYLSNESISVKKIMVTYDSIERLLDFINPSDYNLLVDEYHLLFTQYSFRRAAVIRVLNNYKKFKSYTFMTATPLEDEFILSELRELPIVKCDWEENIPVKVLNVKCDYTVEGAVFDIIKDFLSGKHTGNAYFFVNSLDFI